MSAFNCSYCNQYCCTCSNCHEQIASDGTKGCTRCIPLYQIRLNSQDAALREVNSILSTLPNIVPPHLQQ